MTPLRGADGQVYAIAQGSMLVSGFGVSGKDGSRIAVNVPSGGRIPNGATVEREVGNQFGAEPFVMLKLRSMTDARGPDGELLPDDQRTTRLGRWIRRTSTDELPQLLNVARGEMSAVDRGRPLPRRWSATPRSRPDG